MREAPRQDSDGAAVVRVWIQNETLENVCYWQRRRELADHVFRKRYMIRWYDTTRVEIGMPQAALAGTSEELFAIGIVGLYGYRWVSA